MGQRQTPRTRLGEWHHRVHRGRRRGIEAAVDVAGLGDRGTVDGRDEPRRRPVRIRTDVPSAGGQVGTRDEAGRRVPHSVSRGRPGCARRRRRRGHLELERHRGAGDGEGRRPRHRQEHRRCRAGLRQLRDHRPRRDGAGAEDPRHGAGAQRADHRSLGSHHAVARRDGARGERNATSGLQHSVADRRGDYQPNSHRTRA